MKQEFGSLFSRIFRGGVKPNAFERSLLEIFENNLTLEIKEIVVKQIEMYNLVQREIYGEELNFYHIVNGKANNNTLPKLDTNEKELKLMIMTLNTNQNKEIEANFIAINGYFFCILANCDLNKLKNTKILKYQIIKAYEPKQEKA
jgi:hypothetical protein